MTEDVIQSELPIRTAWDAQDFQTAAALTLELYGRAILGFLIGRLRDPIRGEDAFSMFTEDLWNGLPGFGWRCSMRGWAYGLARNAANRLASAPAQRPERNLALVTDATAQQIMQHVRSATQAYRQTDVKDRVRALREQLPPDDATLLILHIDRGLPWRELAVVMQDGEELLDGEALDREAARLRKRFERIKAELKRMAREQGLIT
jgi:RNA polymerase sigma-70 factor (ECF subfamily)